MSNASDVVGQVRAMTFPASLPWRGRLVLTGLLVFAAACAAPASTPRTRPTELDANVSGDARLLAMSDTRTLDTNLVDELLQRHDPAQRARATLAIGQVHGHARYPRLRQLLLDADTSVAANAAFALGLVHDTGAIGALGRAMAGAPDAVAIEAAWALGEIGEPARAMLALALGEGVSQPLVASTAAQRSAMVRASIVLAGAKVRTLPATSLTTWLSDGATEVVRAAAYTVGRNRLAGGVRPLLTLRNHADDEVRQSVARGLARSATGDSLAKLATDALHELVTDRSVFVRAIAVRSLATFGAGERSVLQRALADGDPNVRVAAAQIMGAMFASDAPAWRTAWQNDTSYMVRRSLLESARQAHSDALAEFENRWMQDADWRLRSAAVEARGADLTGAARTSFLAQALRDTDGRVRASAVGVLLAHPRSEVRNPDSVRVWARTFLADEDVQVRASIVAALGDVADAGDLSAILDAYEHASKDRDSDARQAALQALADAWQRDSAHVSAAVRSRVANLPVSPNPLERAIATRVGPMAAWRERGQAGTAKPMSEYERMARRYLATGAHTTHAIVHTERGDLTLDLFGADAPLTVDNFVQLAQRGAYRDTRFHRVVPAFVAQDGDPRGDGSGGPGYAIRDELSRIRHMRGSLAMALSGPDTGGSQFYLCHTPQPHLDGHYSVFGRMTGGFEVLDRIVQGDRILGIEIR